MINVTGGSKSQQKYVYSIVEFCIQKLMPRMDLNIDVKLKKLDDNAYGYCLATCEDGERNDRPRTFEIEVERNMRLRKVLETVAHEMVHVKQYARGELYESTAQGKHRWQGEWLNKDPDYWDQPWEIEAHGRECGLFVRWAESQDLGKKKWTWDV